MRLEWNEVYKCNIPQPEWTVEGIREAIDYDGEGAHWLNSEFWEGSGEDIARMLLERIDELQKGDTNVKTK